MSDDARIPFNKVVFVGQELEYVYQALANGHISGSGPFTRKCEAFLEEGLGSGKALLTTSCTHALEMSALLLDLQPGDEVALPSFTFVSTANAFVLRGVKPVFVDVRPDTLNLDADALAKAITPKTRAIVPVHYAGVGCAMDRILDVAGDIPVVEDNAQGLFGKYRGRALGSFGVLSTISFHETKNVACGEGGALIINDESLLERAQMIRDKGTNRTRFLQGLVDKYTWVDVGSSYVMSDMLAAFLLAQLEKHDLIAERRAAIWNRYHDGLAGWAGQSGVTLPTVPDDCEQTHHMFYMLLPSKAARDGLIAQLGQRQILSVFHYVPLHLSRMGRSFGGAEGQCPVTEDVSERLVRLPFFNGLDEAQQARVIAAVTEFSP